jgi:hypothetical protein
MQKNKSNSTRSARVAGSASRAKSVNPSHNAIDNAVKIIRTAVKDRTSLSTSSQKHGFGKNYVSDVKARVKDSYRRRAITREHFNTFNSLYKQYESVTK